MILYKVINWTFIIILTASATMAQLTHERILWSFADGATGTAPAIGEDGTIYTAGSSDLIALTSDGKEKWRVHTLGTGNFASPVIGADGTIYVVSASNGRGFLFAITSDGAEKWRVPILAHTNLYSSPAIAADGTIFVGADSTIYAVKPEGIVSWKIETKGNIYSSPAIGIDGTVHIGCMDGYLYAVQHNGVLKWRFEIGSQLLSSPAVGEDGTIYISSSPFTSTDPPQLNPDLAGLYALDLDGNLLWKSSLDIGTHASPIIDWEGNIFLLEPGGWKRDPFGGTVISITPFGTELWRLPLERVEGSTFTSILLGADDTIYLLGEEGGILTLYALDAFGGREFWKISFERGNSPSYLNMTPEGVLFLRSRGSLYAIQTDSPGLADSPWPKWHRDIQNTGRVPSSMITAVTTTHNALPDEYVLLPNFPNPFNATTHLRFALPENGPVRLTIYNAAGQEVAVLVDGEQAAGWHEASWKAEGQASGVYFYRLKAEGFIGIRRMVLLE